MLDVAAGNGNGTLAAARRWCDVTSTDYVPALLEHGRARAAAEGAVIDFREADAENLPFADNSFDVVLSTFGVMFTPDQDQAAAELLRVCKPAARSGWRTGRPKASSARCSRRSASICRRRPASNRPHCGARAPRLNEMFDAGATAIRAESRLFIFRYRSPEALPRHLQDLLRSGAEGVRRARAGEAAAAP